MIYVVNYEGNRVYIIKGSTGSLSDTIVTNSTRDSSASLFSDIRLGINSATNHIFVFRDPYSPSFESDASLSESSVS